MSLGTRERRDDDDVLDGLPQDHCQREDSPPRRQATYLAALELLAQEEDFEAVASSIHLSPALSLDGTGVFIARECENRPVAVDPNIHRVRLPVFRAMSCGRIDRHGMGVLTHRRRVGPVPPQ